MFTVTTQIVIARSPDDVFTFVADQTNAPRWQSGLQGVRRLTSGEIGVGTEHEFTRTFAGKEISTRNRFVRFEPGRLVEFEVPDGWLSGRAAYVVEPVADGTLLKSTMSFTAKGAWRVLEPILRRMLFRDASRDEARLAAILESRTMPDPQGPRSSSGPSPELAAAAGLVCVIVGLVGVISVIFLGLVPPQVSRTTYSYPLAPGDFAIMQGFLALLSLAIAVGMLGVRWSGAAPGRAGLAAAGCSAAGFVLLAALEAISIAFAGVRGDSPQAQALSTTALAIEAATGCAVIALGWVVAVHRHWSGWRAWLPLLSGVALLAVPLLSLLGVVTVSRAATVVWLVLVVILGLTVNRVGNRALAERGAERHRRPAAITVAALLLWFNAASFGISSLVALASVLAGRGLPKLFGFESFGGGPFDRLGAAGLAALLALFAVVCIVEVVAGVLLWQDRRAGRILTLALLPVGAVLWWGFAVPLPVLNGLVRTTLVIVGWSQRKERDPSLVRDSPERLRPATETRQSSTRAPGA